MTTIIELVWQPVFLYDELERKSDDSGVVMCPTEQTTKRAEKVNKRLFIFTNRRMRLSSIKIAPVENIRDSELGRCFGNVLW